jgi:hypothetical protein
MACLILTLLVKRLMGWASFMPIEIEFCGKHLKINPLTSPER